MKIGIVTTWFERGAAYVSKAYMNALRMKHDVFIYARGGERYAIGDENWDFANVTWSKKGHSMQINDHEFDNWVVANKLDIVFFNEQLDWRIILHSRKRFPALVLGSYIDYYTEITLPWYGLYDFVICNTKRHLQAMDYHPQAFYIKWGTNVDLYRPCDKNSDQIVFFHSAGMSTRKGTEFVIKAFIDGKLGKKSKLLIHTQRSLDWATRLTIDELKQENIDIVEGTITAPGLYGMGDIYVYPTRLDGLGLTIYEALSSGLPVITTDYPPMNEVVDESCGCLVRVERNYSRSDAYYWPMSICDTQDLTQKMIWYTESPDILNQQKIAARQQAIMLYNWNDRYSVVCQAFERAQKIPDNSELIEEVKRHYKRQKMNDYFGWIINNQSIRSLRSKMK